MSQNFDFCDINMVEGITVITFKKQPDYDMSYETLGYLAENNLYHYRCYNFQDYKWQFNHQQVVEIANYSKSLLIDKSYACFVARNDLTYATFRELSAYREQDGQTMVAVFRTIEEALRWLQEQKAREEQSSDEPSK